jgi:hypothetical protein
MERTHLQEAIIQNLGAIDPDLVFIADEFSGWVDSAKRLDILAYDAAEGHKVIIELKRVEHDKSVDLQALRYAALAASCDEEDLKDIRRQYLRTSRAASRRGAETPYEEEQIEGDLSSFVQALPDSLRGPTAKSASVRVILIAPQFAPEVIKTAKWLFETFGLKIECHQLTLLDTLSIAPSEHAEFLLSIEKIFPQVELSLDGIRRSSTTGGVSGGVNRDLSKINVQLVDADGEVIEESGFLKKRPAIFQAIKLAIKSGVAQTDLRQIFRDINKIIEVPGHLEGSDLWEEVARIRNWEGATISNQKSRWFCGSGEPFHDSLDNVTWLVSNQWDFTVFDQLDQIQELSEKSSGEAIRYLTSQ